MEIGGEEAFVNIDRGAAAGAAEVAVICDGASVVVDDAILAGDLGTDNGFDLVRSGFAVEACGDEDPPSMGMPESWRR